MATDPRDNMNSQWNKVLLTERQKGYVWICWSYMENKKSVLGPIAPKKQRKKCNGFWLCYTFIKNILIGTLHKEKDVEMFG